MLTTTKHEKIGSLAHFRPLCILTLGCMYVEKKNTKRSEDKSFRTLSFFVKEGSLDSTLINTKISMQNSSPVEREESPNTDNHEGSKLMCLESGIRPNNVSHSLNSKTCSTWSTEIHVLTNGPAHRNHHIVWQNKARAILYVPFSSSFFRLDTHFSYSSTKYNGHPVYFMK